MQWNTVPIANTTCDRYWCDVMMKATCGDDGRQEVTGDRHPGPCRKPCTHASVGQVITQGGSSEKNTLYMQESSVYANRDRKIGKVI